MQWKAEANVETIRQTSLHLFLDKNHSQAFQVYRLADSFCDLLNQPTFLETHPAKLNFEFNPLVTDSSRLGQPDHGLQRGFEVVTSMKQFILETKKVLSGKEGSDES